MTDKTPAMPELPEPELGYIETDQSRQPAFSARQMREALQSAQPAVPMTDEQIEQGYRSTPIVHNADPLVWFEAGVRYVEEHRHIRPNAEAK